MINGVPSHDEMKRRSLMYQYLQFMPVQFLSAFA